MNNKFYKILRFGAIYDLVATALFALGPLAYYAIDSIKWLDHLLGFNTQFQLLDATTIFFFNLGGLFVIIWSVVKIRHPIIEFGLLDAYLRFALIICQIYAVYQGATPILLGISCILFIIGILEIFFSRTANK